MASGMPVTAPCKTYNERGEAGYSAHSEDSVRTQRKFHVVDPTETVPCRLRKLIHIVRKAGRCNTAGRHPTARVEGGLRSDSLKAPEAIPATCTNQGIPRKRQLAADLHK